MLSFSKAAAVVVLLLMGPTMYVVSRAHTLSRAFARIQVGDTVTAVVTTMGKPQDEAQGNVSADSKIEYRYTAWPLPRAWVIGLRDGKVVEKAEVER